MLKCGRGTELKVFMVLMEESLQKGMPQRFKHEPKVGLRRPYFVFLKIFCNFVGVGKLQYSNSLPKRLREHKVEQGPPGPSHPAPTALTISSSRYARGCCANGSCRTKVRLP